MATTFYINPYDQDLNLSKKEHQKLYLDGCQGIQKEERFDGTDENYSSFLKLIGTKIENFCVKTRLKIATEWESTGADIKNPVAGAVLDMWNTNAVTEEQCNSTVIWCGLRRILRTRTIFLQFCRLSRRLMIP